MKNRWMVRVLSESLTFASRDSSATATATFFRRSLCSSASTPSTFALKNVTKSNFESALSDLRRHVRDADFVAVDLEMTGITSAPWRELFEFDRFDIRYLKIKDSAEKFAVVQVGVCPFRWDPSKQSFIAHPHNFFVFPRGDGGPSCDFLCQTTSIDFLAKYQFDFNACISEGISYLSRGQEDESCKLLKFAYENEISEEVRDTPLVRVADVLFYDRMKKKINVWHDELLQHRVRFSDSQGNSDDSNQQMQTVFFKMRPALALNGFTSHQLRLIKMVIRKHFKDLCYVRTTGGECLQQVIVYTDSQNDRDLLMKEVKDDHRMEAEMKIKAAVGFRHVIDLLSSEQKLIVGHNCFLDIAHLYSKFIRPLPSTTEEYVSSVQKYFPYIIDTKVVLNGSNVLQHLIKKSNTSLSRAFALLCPEIASGIKTTSLASTPCIKVEVQVDDMRSSNWNSGAKHEAGYDAFMTGCVFAKACSHLGINFEKKSHPTNLAHHEKLENHLNLLYLSWINGDIINLKTGKQTTVSSAFTNLKRPSPKIIFSNIVLLWGFQSGLKSTLIRACLSKVFGLNSVTSVYRLDETAAFVQFSKAELVHDFLKLKETIETVDDPISVLHPFSEILNGGATHAASYEVYKEICSSSVSKMLFADQAKAVGIKWKTKFVEPEVVEEETEHVDKGVETEKTSDAALSRSLKNFPSVELLINSLFSSEAAQVSK